VFVHRLASSHASSRTKSSSNTTDSHRGRRAVALTLAVAMTNPLGFLQIGQAFAGDQLAPPVLAAEMEQLSADEALAKGLQELRDGMYEEALATLQQVQADQLSSDEARKNLETSIAKAAEGASQRQNARAAFERGEEALAAGNFADAIALYNEAAKNPFADQGTKEKAATQIALAQEQQKKAAAASREDAARQRAEAKRFYQLGREQHRKGDWIAARENLTKAAELGYKPGLFEPSPQKLLEQMDKKEAADRARTEAELAARAQEDAAAEEIAQADAEQPPVAQPQAEPADEAVAEAADRADAAAPEMSERERKAAARAAYNEGRRLHRAGDWIAAREQFNRAIELGFKAGLFETSPERYLAGMDKKEAADRLKTEQELARRQAEEEQARRDAELLAQAEAEARDEIVAEQPAADAEQPAADAEQPADMPADEPAAEESAVEEAAADRPVTPEQELEAAARQRELERQAAAAEAERLVNEAAARRERNDIAGALELYNRALRVDPNNAAAQTGRNEMRELLGRPGEPSSALTRAEQEILRRKEYITWSFDNSMQQARAAIQNRDFSGAQLALQDARTRANQDRGLFNQDEINNFARQINEAQAELDRALAAATEEEAAATAERIRRDVEERERQRAEERQRTVASLVRNSRQLISEGRYREAMGVLDQILQLDPRNDYAIGVRPLVEDRALFMEQREFRETFDRQMTNQLNRAEEMKIPYDDILRYPRDWPDIAEIREESVRDERNISAEDEALIAQLEKRLPEIRFEAVGFADVIDFLRDVSGSNIFVNWRALESAGIDKNAPVTARLRDVKFRKALDVILADVSGGDVPLGFTTGEGVITISTQEDLAKNVVTRVYDIRDLIVNIPDFSDAPDFNLEDASGTGTGTGGGGGGLFGGSDDDDDDEEDQLSREELVEQIIQLITETVAPDSWRDAGGSIGAIRELSGQLIVTQTPENHAELQGLLEQLRETRAIQVTVEARFLTVQRNFLEDIGFDADFVFNPDPTNPWSNKFSEITVSQGSAQFTQNPSTAVPGSIGGLATGSTTGLTVSGSFLDDFEVNFLLRATQASTSNTLLTAPRVTLFNGQRAYVLVATQQAYVSDLTPVVAEGVGLFDPTIDVIESGVLLDVQATVSSDRKYVTLTLRPQLATLLALVPFAIQFANITTAQAGTGSGGAQPGGGIPSDSVTTPSQSGQAAGIIQQPILQVTEVRTTVSVPDGGTILLGGQTLAGEVEREMGVPVLSKVPFLKRLFTNRSVAKDEQILLILVKPTIIIQKEAEQRQFPLLSSRVAGG
jgi:type II secretory pathway component GspD/PulD (secretin)/tetratricopeptide (TPR) repeat protein